jgi:hypothetical protein
MEILANTLRQRLMAKGVEGTVIPAYIRNVANILATESPVSLWELNRWLQLLGWDDFELDDYTLELVRSVFDPNVDYVPPQWYDTIPDSEKLDTMNDKRESLLRLERGIFRGLDEWGSSTTGYIISHFIYLLHYLYLWLRGENGY